MSETTPTVVLVHGALSDASVWHDVIISLHQKNIHVVAPAMPMRGLRSDAEYLRSFLSTLEGPIVVAGHSYGGSIISHPSALTPAVRGLVFIAAFQQDRGESAGELNGRFPGSKLVAESINIRPHANGSDLYLKPEHFADVYASDVESSKVAVMAASQRPIDPSALSESFDGEATWRTLPSWALISTADRSLPAAAMQFMARRAGSSIVEVDSSHAASIAHALDCANLIVAAVEAVVEGKASSLV